MEWDILRVPAERHVKVYACCPEPYPGEHDEQYHCRNLVQRHKHVKSGFFGGFPSNGDLVTSNTDRLQVPGYSP